MPFSYAKMYGWQNHLAGLFMHVPEHSRVSSDSVLIIEGRVWSQAANSADLWEVLLFGFGLEKLMWEC